MNTIFIGVAGGTGSGKTTLTEHLAERFLSGSAATSAWYIMTTTTSGRTAPLKNAAARTTTTPMPLTPI